MKPETEAPVSAAAEGREPTVAAEIDVEALAERVYRLMLRDLRLERARGGESERRRRLQP
jgi:hypothetical protein